MLNFTQFGPEMEESFGLYLLFRMRGVRQVPPEVVLITLDNESSENLNLPANPLKWPRDLHAKLIGILTDRQAAVIAYDVLFSEPSIEAHDESLARAIERAGNVVLCEHLRKDLVQMKDVFPSKALHLERSIPPLDLFSEVAAALGPFPLPKVPVRVSQYWKFKTGAGCKPTLPLLAFQVFSAGAYGEFLQLLEEVSPSHAGILPDSEAVRVPGNPGKVSSGVRELLEDAPWVAREMLDRLKRKQRLAGTPGGVSRLEAYIRAFTQGDSVFLNFYGPPGSVVNIPFHRVLNGGSEGHAMPDFKGKAIFIGLSEITRADQRDGFHTVYSRSDGTDLSGVEIAATAFANLLEAEPVRPASNFVFMGICLLWGLVFGFLCFVLPVPISAGIAVGCILVYTAVAHVVFKNFSVWVPLAVPFFILTPLALCTGTLWQHRRAKNERRQMRKAFGFFLPDDAIDRIMTDIKAASGILQSRQTVFGAVLCSDGAQYTSLSERLSPKELNDFLNRYYETLFKPVQIHGGTVSDIIGDSMMAVWAKAHPDVSLKRGACLAALGIREAFADTNGDRELVRMDTRIGLHYGQLLLGTVGGGEHFEYRPVGDVVNTAARIEGLNKKFGTRILASEEVLGTSHGFLTRELGRFLLYGKSNAVTVHELLCTLEAAPEMQKSACLIFSEALRAFEGRSWNLAESLFRDYLKLSGEDKAARYYIGICEFYRRYPPGELWDGLISIDAK